MPDTVNLSQTTDGLPASRSLADILYSQNLLSKQQHDDIKVKVASSGQSEESIVEDLKIVPEEKLAEEIVKENKISKFDVHTLTSEKAIGIPDIRNLQKDIFLKPGFSEKKIIIIEGFNQITVDAQNAFLKTLEEPPQNTIILILVNSLDFILPTILSRCNLINLTKERKNTEDTDTYSKLFESLLENKENPLIIAQDYGKNKESALKLLENLIILTEKNLSSNHQISKTLKNLQETYSTIKSTNVNPRFALEILFLKLYKI